MFPTATPAVRPNKTRACPLHSANFAKLYRNISVKHGYKGPSQNTLCQLFPLLLFVFDSLSHLHNYPCNDFLTHNKRFWNLL